MTRYQQAEEECSKIYNRLFQLEEPQVGDPEELITVCQLCCKRLQGHLDAIEKSIKGKK